MARIYEYYGIARRLRYALSLAQNCILCPQKQAYMKHKTQPLAGFCVIQEQIQEVGLVLYLLDFLFQIYHKSRVNKQSHRQ
jgi:hypothetical protein